MATVNIMKNTRSQTRAGLAFILSYCKREAKTQHEDRKLVTGINCVAEFAYREMMNTKLQYGKTDGRMFYHLVQSFSPDERITPQRAHELALKLAEREFHGFEVLVATHVDKHHREYLQVGQYTELIFPSYGIRFIAVNDGVDSLYENTNDFTPFRNIINEFYAKDCSKKGRTSARIKAETGARIATRPLYGYKKDPDDPMRHIVPDEETSWAVKHIFALCAQGSGPAQIAKQLEREQIVNPSNHYYRKYGKAMTGLDTSRPYRWTSATVASILENETYLGHTINLRYTTISYKNKQRIMRPESEQLRFENTHEPLVDRQTWEIVQDIRKHKRRRAKFAEQNMLSGLVYCADCGSTMRLHRAHTFSAVKNNFMCSTYKNKGKEVCSAHYIREVDLAAVLLDDIRRITHFARQNEQRFARYIGMKQGKEAQREIKALQKKAADMGKRQSELTALFKRLYEDNALGRITDEQFRMLSKDYTKEQAEIEEALPKVKEQLQKLKDSAANIGRFLENARKYTEINELTCEILHIFIQRIEIGERSKRYSRSAAQEIRIYYRDIGLIDEMPETMITAESRSETIELKAAENEMAEDEKDTPTTQSTKHARIVVA